MAWRLCVAPMMDWTDRHCRVFHRLLAPQARLYTEMVHAHAVLRGDRERLLAFDPFEHPVALQLGGSEPALLAQAARIGHAFGYDEINLNVGCPSERVQAGSFGACLMREPTLVADCVAAMRGALPAAVPVTVKCRIGVDEQNERDSLFALTDGVMAAGCEVLIVHARKAWLEGLSPKENRQLPPLNYALVHELKRACPRLVVVLNGGLATAEMVAAQLRCVDGVMLGRTAYHEPYVLHELARQLFEDQVPPLQDRATLLRSLRRHVEGGLARGVALKHLVRPVIGLFHAQPGGRLFRQVLSEGMAQPRADWTLIERALAATATVGLQAVEKQPASRDTDVSTQDQALQALDPAGASPGRYRTCGSKNDPDGRFSTNHKAA